MKFLAGHGPAGRSEEYLFAAPGDTRHEYLTGIFADNLRGRRWEDMARPQQLPPAWTWRFWVMLAGRGSGKTRAAAEYVQAEVMAGRARHVAVVGRTAADVRDVMVEGPSGLLAVAPGYFRPVYESSKRRLTWPNGAQATTFSADEPDLLRGPQHGLAWCDELAAFERAQETWDNLLLGLRLGQARCVVSTTPRPIPLIRDLASRAGRDVALSKMTTYENLANLAPAFAADIVSKYANTTIGRQELLAEILTDLPGALWTRELLDKTRVEKPPMRRQQDNNGDRHEIVDLTRTIIAVDPTVSARPEGASECGIVVVGQGRERPPHAYVLEDASVSGSLHMWASRAVLMYRKWRASFITAEVNQGGDLIRRILSVVDSGVPVNPVRAVKNKEARAHTVQPFYEQGRVHHVGVFSSLEEEMCSWVPSESESPDRLDALVWGVLALLERPLTLEDRLALMTDAERMAYHERQAALAARIFQF